MNGRANDGIRSVVHAGMFDSGALYSRCIIPRRGGFCGEPGRMYLARHTKAPVTCKLCLRILAKERSQ